MLLRVVFVIACILIATSQAVDANDSDCICVPYYLCNSTVDGTIYIHGEGVLDMRMDQHPLDKECPLDVDSGAPEFCCHIPDILKNGKKPDKMLSELKVVHGSKQDLDEIFSKSRPPCSIKNGNFGNQGSYDGCPEAEISTVPEENIKSEELDKKPCSVKNRNFGDQGSYDVIDGCPEAEISTIPEENKKTEELVKPCSVTNRNFGDQGTYEFLPDCTEENSSETEATSSEVGQESSETVENSSGNNKKTYEFVYPTPWQSENANEEHVQEEVEHQPEVTTKEVQEESSYRGDSNGYTEHLYGYEHKHARRCGLPVGLGVRVLGGHVADLPWLVHISTKGQYNVNKKTTCGGSLLLDNLVLTAAHCLSAAILNREVLVVKTARMDQEIVVRTVTIHPKYSPDSLLYDFALLWLESPIHLGTQFGTGLVCLPRHEHHVKHCFATGFIDDAPSKVFVPMVPQHECQDLLRTTRLGSLFHLHDSFVCAGGKNGKDTCKGDGGSPLVCSLGEGDDPVLTQMGLVAWGIGCGTEIPGVYANTKVARDWIDEEVTARGLDPHVYHVPALH